MKRKQLFITLLVCLVSIGLVISPVMAKKKPSLNSWKPAFDPSGAKYKCIVSNVSHPVLKGVYAGFAIRDELWKRTNGQIYLDYFPLSILGGEVEVMNQLQMGAIQGMGVTAVAGTNLGPRIGLLNLPFLIDSFEKLDKFAASGKLFDHYMMAMDHQGIMGIDLTTYGNYGWATTKPVRSIADAKPLKFRTAEASVNQLTYKAWGLNATAMPWPDVPIALKQGVIDGLDHTAIVCNITKKFEVAKYFTYLEYAQGLVIWVFNKDWMNSLPADLREIFIQTVKDVSAEMRAQCKMQEAMQIMNASKKGIEFYTLPKKDMELLRKQGYSVHKKFAPEINKLYPGDKYRPSNYLQEVQDYLEYKRY
jgi:TRAP-type C4-dicarboxylate transport system substrate-binding protein